MYKLSLPIISLIALLIYYITTSYTQDYPSNYSMLKGKFEIHITVGTESDLDHFKQVCQSSKEIIIKPVLIELPYGETASQLMTSSSIKGSFADALKNMESVAEHLEKSALKIIRKKIELKFENSEGIPETFEEVNAFPPSNYFEYHIKVAYKDGTDLTELMTIEKKHGAHLSRSALKDSSKAGMKERFLTLRFYEKNRDDTLHVRDLLLSDLQQHHWEVTKVENEYAVYDTNVDVDRGWITKKN